MPPRLTVLMFTDLVDSSSLKSELGDEDYVDCIALPHNRMFREILARFQDAKEVNDTGDGFLATFDSVSDAVNAALLFHHALRTFDWQWTRPMTRIGIHLEGTAEIPIAYNEQTFAGDAADICARVMSLATGGQTLLTRDAFNIARQHDHGPPETGAQPPTQLQWIAHGRYRLSSAIEPMEVFEVGGVGLAPLEKPAGSAKARSDDRVHFVVTSPAEMIPGERYVVDFWIHRDEQREEVHRRSREESHDKEISIASEGPIAVSQESMLTVSLTVEDLVVTVPQEKTLQWFGEIGKTRFAVTVPEDVRLGRRHGCATVRLNGLRIADVFLVVHVRSSSKESASAPTSERRYRRAFASYSSDDRDDVLARIQGIQKAAPDMDVFLDVAKVRSGENWQHRMREEIVSRDVLYLFWSEAASRSKWVDWEWRCGLTEHGIRFIDPCPLVSPELVPPPRELAEHLHFNDWVLAFMRRSGPRDRFAVD